MPRRKNSIPPELQAEVLRRAAAGDSTRAIARWLQEAHGLEIHDRTVGRFLARHRGLAGDSVTPKGPTDARRDPKSRKPSHAICGARTRCGGLCRHRAGVRTNHPGEGRCWLHGGRNRGGPPGNKKALTTGEYETIYADKYEADDLATHTRSRVNIDGLEEEIRMLKVRARRMLGRIQTLKTRGELGGNLVMTEQADYSTVTDQLRDAAGRFTPEAADVEPEQVSVSRRRTYRSLDDALRYQEEALTRVQGRMIQAMRIRAVLIREAGPQDERDILAEIRDALANGGP